MTDKQIIIDDQKKTIHRLQDECTEKTNAIIALGEQLQRKQQSEEKLVNQIKTICDFINNRPETFKGINGSVDKIITDYAERKEQECEELNEWKKEHLKDVEFIESNPVIDILNSMANNILLEQQLDQLEEENISLKKQLQFEFDETLLQYSNTIEDLQKQLKDSVMQKCPQCGETYLNPVGAKLYETLIEIKELVQSDYCTEIGSCEFCAEIGNCLNRKILHKISEVIDE